MGFEVTRSEVELTPDHRRVVPRPYLPGDSGRVAGPSRAQRLVNRVLALPSEALEPTLADVYARFADRHLDLDAALEEAFDTVAREAKIPDGLSRGSRMLVAAYFIHEYSIEAAALTNPSIVMAPDQSGVPPDWLRVIVSLRGVGEGHISSIQFREGLVGPRGEVRIEEPGPPVLGTRSAPLFDKTVFVAALHELVSNDEDADRPDQSSKLRKRRSSPVEMAMAPLPDRFTLADLEAVLRDFELPGLPRDMASLAKTTVHWLAASNYESAFPGQSQVSQRVLFPLGPTESRGMEDARFVRFTRDDGSVVYYGTYTAYDGFHILPQLIETEDFSTFRIATMTGGAARNKGIAIFPRPVNGRFVALSRSDAESNHVMWSDHVRVWQETERIQVPIRPWELMQIGNAGAPIETDAGWLVITHAVGPMRTYALGAILLDLHDPTRVIGHLPEPLVFPQEDERDGYVPNVVYSCGQIVHDGMLVIAYGASDTITRFATVPLDVLLTELTSPAAATPTGRRSRPRGGGGTGPDTDRPSAPH